MTSAEQRASRLARKIDDLGVDLLRVRLDAGAVDDDLVVFLDHARGDLIAAKEMLAEKIGEGMSRRAREVRVGDRIVFPEEMRGRVVRVMLAEVEPSVVIVTERPMSNPRESRVVENQGAFDSWQMLTVAR
jgi:hypothetical protein